MLWLGETVPMSALQGFHLFRKGEAWCLIKLLLHAVSWQGSAWVSRQGWQTGCRGASIVSQETYPTFLYSSYFFSLALNLALCKELEQIGLFNSMETSVRPTSLITLCYRKSHPCIVNNFSLLLYYQQSGSNVCNITLIDLTYKNRPFIPQVFLLGRDYTGHPEERYPE
jgi:hypothetical protein